jgi:UDP:flavonoid glycosyltransferase YjiC (YdhE family)
LTVETVAAGTGRGAFQDNRRMDTMKILIASTPANGHMNPMLAIARILMTEDHDVAIYTGSAFRARVEAAGAKFFSCHPKRILT